MFDSSTTYTQGGVESAPPSTMTRFSAPTSAASCRTIPIRTSCRWPHARIARLPELTLNVPSASGKQCTEFGVKLACVDINYYQNQVSATWPRARPSMRLATPSSCWPTCTGRKAAAAFGGYHSANGPQTYNNFTYITTAGVFSQDVSALSHEIGEWTDDPLYPHQNNTPCGILEVGDPLENGQPGHPYGTWAYPLHGFTYHLQDLVLLRLLRWPRLPCRSMTSGPSRDPPVSAPSARTAPSLVETLARPREGRAFRFGVDEELVHHGSTEITEKNFRNNRQASVPAGLGVVRALWRRRPDENDRKLCRLGNPPVQ